MGVGHFFLSHWHIRDRSKIGKFHLIPSYYRLRMKIFLIGGSHLFCNGIGTYFYPKKIQGWEWDVFPSHLHIRDETRIGKFHLIPSHCQPQSTPIIWCNTQSATALSSNPKFHFQTKHIELDIHFLREKVANKSLQIQYIPNLDQTIDIFTKALSFQPVHYLKSKVTSFLILNLKEAVGSIPKGSSMFKNIAQQHLNKLQLKLNKLEW